MRIKLIVSSVVILLAGAAIWTASITGDDSTKTPQGVGSMPGSVSGVDVAANTVQGVNAVMHGQTMRTAIQRYMDGEGQWGVWQQPDLEMEAALQSEDANQSWHDCLVAFGDTTTIICPDGSVYVS